VGAVPGYASPISIDRERALVVADDSIYLGSNFVTGANREGYHLTGVNAGRDFQPDKVLDIALVRDGDPCPRCGGRLRVQRGIELGHCFKLGTRYTAPGQRHDGHAVTALDAEGSEQYVVMGSYGIGLGRLLAAVVETHHDAHGICWPIAIAPYAVHLVSLVRAPEQTVQADALYKALVGAGIEVLYDDRIGLSAGVKFNDADLIGCPLRLTFSRRNLEQGRVEAKLRTSAERERVAIEDASSYARRKLGQAPE
jgi:prolyl-tRNA synthetase